MHRADTLDQTSWFTYTTNKIDSILDFIRRTVAQESRLTITAGRKLYGESIRQLGLKYANKYAYTSVFYFDSFLYHDRLVVN